MTATLNQPLTPSPDGPAVLVAADYAQGSRARRGERLDHVFEERCDWMRSYGRTDHLAVDAGDVTLTFGRARQRANQLARHLLARGARPGDRIALLFDQAVHSYVAMLAVLKINAAYVPLDVGFPADRIAYIIEDAGCAAGAVAVPRAGQGRGPRGVRARPALRRPGRRRPSPGRARPG